MIKYSNNLVNSGYLWLKSFFDYDQSQKYMERLCQAYLVYTFAYSQSIELNHVLDVPVDFQIELMMLNIHIWLLLDRLKQLDKGAFSQTIPGYFISSLDVYSNEFLTSFHMGRKTKHVYDTREYLKQFRKRLDQHFRENMRFAANPADRIDALVWSALLLEKCDRYDNRVYLLASYLLETWKALQQYDFEDFKNLKIVFNPFVVPVDYRKQLEAINPPLSRADYEADKQLVDPRLHRFRYDYKEPSGQLPRIDQVSLAVQRLEARKTAVVQGETDETRTQIPQSEPVRLHVGAGGT
jgi:hypothetical protein